ncbi:hypothetical protein BC830DRAFT_1152785, partial [Chytriomyces sp. MP71]
MYTLLLILGTAFTAEARRNPTAVAQAAPIDWNFNGDGTFQSANCGWPPATYFLGISAADMVTYQLGSCLQACVSDYACTNAMWTQDGSCYFYYGEIPVG